MAGILLEAEVVIGDLEEELRVEFSYSRWTDRYEGAWAAVVEVDIEVERLHLNGDRISRADLDERFGKDVVARAIESAIENGVESAND